MTTTQDVKNTARSMLEALDGRNIPALKELCAPNIRIQIASQQLDLPSWLGMGEMFSAAFPDGKHEVEAAVAEGDRVVLRCTWRGTQRGAFQGIAATNRTVALTTFLEFRVVDGRVVEYRGLFDALGMMQELGALPK